jgi:hypothetical protein
LRFAHENVIAPYTDLVESVVDFSFPGPNQLDQDLQIGDTEVSRLHLWSTDDLRLLGGAPQMFLGNNLDIKYLELN